jgi:hypothetical protein
MFRPAHCLVLTALVAAGSPAASELHLGPERVVVVSSKSPESYFGVDLANEVLVIHEPNSPKGIRPPIAALRALSYDAGRLTLTVRWQARSRVESAAWPGVTQAEWARLRSFVAQHLGSAVVSER